MKVYFDNRGGTYAHSTLFCDDELFGHIVVLKDDIFLVEIPDNVRTLRVTSILTKYESEKHREESVVKTQPTKKDDFESYEFTTFRKDAYETSDFHIVTENPSDVDLIRMSNEVDEEIKAFFGDRVPPEFADKELPKQEIKDLQLCFEKESIDDYDLVKKSWQYPYDAFINLNGCNEDVILYQFPFPQEELSCALGYRARFMSDGQQIDTKYVKRKKKFNSTIVWILSIFAMIALCVCIINGVPELWNRMFSGNPTRGDVSGFILAIMLIILLPALVMDVAEQHGFLIEHKLKAEYHIDKYEQWSFLK